MKYILLIDSRVVEVIPEVDPNFLDIPITERYARTVLSQCIIVPDDTETPMHHHLGHQRPGEVQIRPRHDRPLA